MDRAEGRWRPLRNALACMATACALAACGGGGGGSSPKPPDDGGGSTGESTFLLAEFVAADSNQQRVRVWDPAHPEVAIQNVTIVQSSGIAWTSSHLAFSDATQYDAATRTMTTLGHAKVFFDNDGKLYSIDLRGGRSHAPVQLSSATDVFTTTRAFPTNAAGDDAWVDVQGGTHHWAVHSTMGASDAPMSVLSVVAALRDATTGLPQYFFCSLGGESGTAVQPTTFEVVDTQFAPVAVAAVASMGNYDSWVGADPAQPGLGYLSIAGKMRALHWSAGAVGVDTAVLHTFAFNFGASPAVADAQALYFTDSTTLLSVANAAVSTVGSFSLAPAWLVDAGGFVAAQEQAVSTVGSTRYQVETLAKTGGTLMLVEPANQGVQLVGATDQWLILTGTAEQVPGFVLANGADTDRRVVGSQFVGVVRAAAARPDQAAAPVALLSCVAATGGFCGPGALTQDEIGTGAATQLGLLSASAPWARGDATVGIEAAISGQNVLPSPGGFGHNQTDRRDAWQFMPKSAGSLARVTASLP